MKKIMLAVTAVFVSAALFAQNATQQKKAEDVVKFKELTYNFGKIKQNAPVNHDFVFSNTSDKPVIIESATPSCGCTTPVFPQAPVAAGKADKITAGFNAAAAGPFNKTITVKVAGIDAPLEIRITGDVLTADDYAKFEKEKGSKTSKTGGNK
ncbi:MAG: DUF1573 domain-containing protein [Chitinophagaceae bacterium]|nr:DUF1573 domain-containing protein [Chitinophagaceae bacterium]